MAHKDKKSIAILAIAIAVIIIGAIGCIFCIVGIVSVNNFELNLPDTTELTSAVKGGLDTASTLIGNLSVALKNGSETVSEAKGSLYNVRDIVDNTANAVHSIADSMDFNILGFQPLAGASEYFNKVAASIEELGGKIIDIADNIDVNTGDAEKIAENLEDLSLKLKDISNNFGSSLFMLPDFGFKRILYAVLTLFGALSLTFSLIGAGLILLNRRMDVLLVKP